MTLCKVYRAEIQLAPGIVGGMAAPKKARFNFDSFKAEAEVYPCTDTGDLTFDT